MTHTTNFRKTPLKTTETIVLPVYKGQGAKSPVLKSAAKVTRDTVDAVVGDKSFKGEIGDTRVVLTADKDSKVTAFVIVALGEKKDLTALKAEDAGGALFKTLKANNLHKVALCGCGLAKNKNIDENNIAAHIANGVALAAYDYSEYKKKPKDAYALDKFDIVIDTATHAENVHNMLDAVAQGTVLARDLINMPPNDLYPDAYAKLIRKELKPLGVDVEIIDDKKLIKMGAGAITAVGQGSDRLPRMVIMKWNGAKTKKKAAPLALIGKGVTFDTGGISLKPGADMDEMKMDMGGSAAVVGTMKALALAGVKANIVAGVGLAENMPSSKAYRPGDVITSLSGKTIEVLNTDAEGRLVMADVMTHVQRTYKPERMIDLATLTGAMMVALAHEYCGTFVNDDDMWDALEKASATSGEKLWRMPLDKEFKDSMKGDFGDVQNLSKMGRWGGACTAAGFLEHFVDDGVKWAHMDIAGTAWIKKPKPTVPKFGTGFGVRVLVDYIRGLV